ncbi:hypothetical protein QFC21_006869 [Naganishia friedmannii]|uniref:Uncharacterized protein n=1 Tax=Naganishia friedmannii TaxID=89922 RepID=A0ACC2V040_9TREE|nr:hypothetical protein QFC21_006869 [Naganishia friedmannii]
MPVDWQGEPSIIQRLFHHDIVLVVADHLAADDYYGSISSLSKTAHTLKDVLQPYLEQKKTKVWMRFEDWSWEKLEESGMQEYAQIGIVECSIDSKLPINNVAPAYIKQSSKKGFTGYAKEQQLVNFYCQPWMMIWKGHPHRASMTIYERFFPGIEVLKFSVDSGAMRAGELHNRATIKRSRDATAAANDIATLLMKKQVLAERSCGGGFEAGTVPRLVFLRYDGYSGTQPVSYGKISSSVQAVGKAGYKYDRQEWSYYGEDEDLSHAEGYYLYQATFDDKEPQQQKQFTSIRIDIHICTANPSSMLFCKRGETWTKGYAIFSDLTEYLAAQHLSATKEDARLDFRLFHNHGKPLVYENVPIFCMCIGGAAAGGNGRLRVLHKSIDKDFANCRLQEGCKRCVGLGEEIVVIT